jgi:hypothetical protein
MQQRPNPLLQIQMHRMDHTVADVQWMEKYRQNLIARQSSQSEEDWDRVAP